MNLENNIDFFTMTVNNSEILVNRTKNIPINWFKDKYNFFGTHNIKMEFHYAIVLNKWIFKNFKNQIGLIGGEEKIKVIKKLMTYSKYKEYLGIDYFTDYISVPEKLSCNEPKILEETIKEQLTNAKGKVFLFGIGISKLYVAHKFKDFFPATYIDAGGTMSALSGFITKKRPYAGNWTNFRIKNYDYSKLDPMDVTNNENIIFL